MKNLEKLEIVFDINMLNDFSALQVIINTNIFTSYVR